MFFSKSLVASAALCLSLSLSAHAHAGVTPALGVQGTFARNNVQRPSAAKPCGNTNIAQTLDTSTAIAASANGSFAATITNFNAGVDGSRQVTAQIDATGTGQSFVDAQVLQNGDKNPTSTGSQQLVVQIPAGTTCGGGATANKCLVAFTTAGGFGNCAVVAQTGAAANADAPASGADVATGAVGDSAAATATASGAAATAADTATGAATATTAATGTGTGRKHRHKDAAAANAAGVNAATANGNANGIVAKLRQGANRRAFGTRAARLARRAGERPAVEVIA